MGTRSEILIKEHGIYNGKKWSNKIKLYHHFDGYPSGVGKFLMETIYPLLMTSHIDVDEVANTLVKNKEDDSFEVTSAIHSDIEYFYEIDTTLKTIKCWKVHYTHKWDDKPCRLRKIKEENIMCFATKDKVSVSYA